MRHAARAANLSAAPAFRWPARVAVRRLEELRDHPPMLQKRRPLANGGISPSCSATLWDPPAFSAGLDAEDWRDLVGAYLDAASAAVTEMGGHVAKKLGDGLMALFGYPLARDRCRLLSTFAHTNSVMVSRQTKTLFGLRTTILRLCDFDAKSFS